MFRRMVLITLLLAGTGAVWAEDTSVDASISSDKISLKDSAQLTVTIHGGKGDIDPVSLPKIDGLDSSYLGPSTQVSIVNGQYSSQKSFIYNLFPNKTGRMQIPALTVTVGGQNYTTQPINLEVVQGDTDQGAVAAASSQQRTPSTAEGLKDRISMTIGVPKAQVYLGEKVPLTVKLFVNQLPMRNLQFPKMEKNGFTMDDFTQPKQYAQEVNGVKYDVVEFGTYLYPTAAGNLTIGPVQIEAGLLYKTQQRRNAFGSAFFNDDFFNGFFDNYQERPLTVTSSNLKISVLPLPQEGRPDNFSGAVGQLDFNALISPLQVKVGDPVTLRMKISGSANFKSMPMPVFNDSAFKTYDPQVKNEGNALTLEQVIIPTGADLTEVPALSFSYFDPVTGGYKTLTQGPFPLKVTAPAPGQEFKAIGFNELTQKQAPVQQVDYVQKYIKDPFDKAVAVCKTAQFWLAVLGLVVLWGLWVVWSRFRQRLAQDAAFARRLNAAKTAKQGLAQAEKLLKAGDAKNFYSALHKTLSTYVRDKELKEEAVSGLKALYEAADLVRFAGGKADAAQMNLHLAQAKQMIR